MWLWLWLSRGLWLVLLRISKRSWRWFLCEFPKCHFHVLLVSLWIWRISTAPRLPEEYHHLQCYHERVWKSRRVAACIDAFWGPRTGCECLGVLYSFPGADYGTHLDGNKSYNWVNSINLFSNLDSNLSHYGTKNPHFVDHLLMDDLADIQQLKFREEPGLGSHEHLV